MRDDAEGTSRPQMDVMAVCTALADRAKEIFDKQAAMGCTFRECLAAVYSVGVQAGAEVAQANAGARSPNP